MNPGSTEKCVLEVRNLTRRYNAKVALDDFSLSVPKGCVYGLLGKSGAGKTTLIMHLLGLLKAQTGSVRVLGRDPVKDPEGTLSRIGYLSEDRDMPHWMKVGELLRYTQGFYPKWDDSFASDLVRDFELDLNQKVRTLSQGQKAKTGLILALSARPELLILDEPSSGLDPVVRRELVTTIMRNVAQEGRTVFFSSHLLGEVERVADHVAIVDDGKLLLSGPIDDVIQAHSRITLRFDKAQKSAPLISGALNCQGTDHEWTLITDGDANAIRGSASALNATIVNETSPTLEEIFVARVGTAV